MTQTYQIARLFNGERFHRDAWLTIDNGKIVALGHGQAPSQAKALTGTLVPGFVDVQVNGGGGALFNGDRSVNAIATIGAAHARYGTTAFLPTLITDSLSVLQEGADAIAAALRERCPGVIGVHFEGPHLSVAKKGVHSAEHIRPLTDAEMAVYTRSDLGTVVVTLAPETVPASQIAELVAAGVRVCLGHSNADYATAQAALEAGASGFTHLFNAMSPFTSREPGMVGAALLDPHSWCGLIVDGHHVDDASLKLAIQAKAAQKMMLVTDAMPPVGMEGDTFTLLGRTIRRDGDKLTAPTGELAGSVLDMASAVRNSVHRLGVSEAEAFRMASRYPAEFLGLEQPGRLRVGGRADMVLLDDDFQVQQCWIGGEAVLKP
ncbi:N-acetylglucosamine-6-phosphate deacetylase [Ferrimonas balearica]|uniref:N-acetylglucosamine-6-phosphate deacetylase n=1 Tax=Ferrimonas balearica TaxID=44012 RepID=UPI001C574E3A|nr:N-acetylglucosamine-6-phosphate deacetylase [Ferrimonas balearica]MBW3139884.1 N-acetylglucosamine-6-phosphate deacetylase [Ferrimonas balearica]MBY5980227.1 N-acetylglucosamine-6-phosphate deacetylase [Ferrimonas balearica]MBY6107010.1 N-acetylglucosamine-6-phosphate deacetylase [Ferrimonas balearica]MBY6224434.1 N-acetylglucosamine-6-phosphate deacetylase [Ferrimonas balearica]